MAGGGATGDRLVSLSPPCMRETIMQFLTLALECYFATVLGVAGLAKMDDPAPFAATLWQHLLPTWSVGTIGRLLPSLEIAMAGALLSGIAAIPVATFTVLIFAGFLVVQTLLLATRHGSDCGCYGAASSHRIEGSSVMTASLLLMLAGIHLWLVIEMTAIAWHWRLAAGVLGAMAGSWLGWRTWQRRRSVRCLQRPARMPLQVWIRSRRGSHPISSVERWEHRAAPDHAGAEERAQRSRA